MDAYEVVERLAPVVGRDFPYDKINEPLTPEQAALAERLARSIVAQTFKQ